MKETKKKEICRITIPDEVSLSYYPETGKLLCRCDIPDMAQYINWKILGYTVGHFIVDIWNTRSVYPDHCYLKVRHYYRKGLTVEKVDKYTWAFYTDRKEVYYSLKNIAWELW